jgi:hypothetical protein
MDMKKKPMPMKADTKYKRGGSCSKKMAKGGSVCRGGGAATKGVKFKGVM